MKVVTHENYDQMSKNVAQRIAQVVTKKPNAVLCLPTGSTPIGLYREIIRLHKEENLDFSNVTAFNLDEYFGLPEEHPQSYSYYLWNRLYKHINIPKENIHYIRVLSNKLEDVDQYCQEHDATINELGGFDLLVDGIGLNGHIGFNEPADELIPHTHLEPLSQSTIDENSRFFDSKNDVPRYALTMGMGTIFKAKQIILIASGSHKSEIVHKILHSNVTTQIPATLLHLHQNIEMHLDHEAAKLL